ncbi:MAG: class I SAM-dependent methyltransferase [Candidatus Cloacimonetes bacterium]|nr:class I SAM-dependent methyltransferase [Candidatus Cloacimonadota bacterium]
MNKIKVVKEFFNNTDVYLRNNSNIILRKQIVRKLLKTSFNKNILDIGCGNGTLSLQFLGNENKITLLDISMNMLDIAKNNIPSNRLDSVSLINVDFLEHEFKDTYDIVICVGVLAHVDSVDDTIKKIAKIINPGGKCIFQLTNYSSLIGKMLVGYYWLISTLKREDSYFVNTIKLKDIVATAKKLNLFPINNINYVSLLPCMGLMNPERRYKFQYFTMNNRIISKFGTEVFILFKKQGSMD